MQEFYSTALHELGHSTGHESRLNRNIENLFGTPDYALEELRAEIASMFIEQDLEIQVDAEHKRNNSAYIAAWKKEIKDNPNALFTAITDADKIAKYVSLKVQQKNSQAQDGEKKQVEKYAIVTDKNHTDDSVRVDSPSVGIEQRSKVAFAQFHPCQNHGWSADSQQDTDNQSRDSPPTSIRNSTYFRQQGC